MRLRLVNLRAMGVLSALSVLAPLAITLVLPAGLARAQSIDSLGLRPDFDSGFPTSPSNTPDVSPEETVTQPPALVPAGVDAPPAGSSFEPAASQDQRPSNDEDQTGPNYGKPRKRKPNLYAPPRKLYTPNPDGSPPLPALVPYRGAPGTKKQLNPQPPLPFNGTDTVPPGPTVAVTPPPKRVRKPPVDPTPFEATGIQVGEMRLLPYVETTAGYETNPNQVTTGVKASPALRAEAGLDVQSDFPTNSLTASLRGGYSDFPSNSNANRPDANGVVDGRLDVTRDDQILGEARFAVATQTPGSPLLAAPTSVFITSRPTIINEGATLGGTHTFNRLSIGLKGTFDRTEFGDAEQSNGTIFRYSQENFNDYGVVARAAYEVWPAFVPFVEAGADDRVHDQALDLSGYYRDSVGVVARAGATLEFTRLLTGTLSAGYGDRHYADPRLSNLHGPTVDGALAYAVTPLTTIRVSAVTDFAETTLPAVSGAIARIFSLEVDHQLFRNFTLSGIATYQPNEYQGIVAHEVFTSFTGKAAYAVTRDVQLIASASRQNLSTTLGDGFRDYIFLTGVRLQR